MLASAHRLSARIFGSLQRRASTSSAVFLPAKGGSEPSKLPALLAVRRRDGREAAVSLNIRQDNATVALSIEKEVSSYDN